MSKVAGKVVPLVDPVTSWKTGGTTRRTKSEIVRRPKKLAFALVFQLAPVWLLSLTPGMTSSIYIVDFDSFVGLVQHITTNHLDIKLYNSLVTYLVWGLFRFSPRSANTLYLISGDVQFLSEKASKLRKERGIYITDKNNRFRKAPSSPLQLSRIKHFNLGGPSNLEVLWSYHNIQVNIYPRILKRRIGDYIDYSIRPSLRSGFTQHINHKQLLPIEHMDA